MTTVGHRYTDGAKIQVGGSWPASYSDKNMVGLDSSFVVDDDY
jgi:hypothetical protein